MFHDWLDNNRPWANPRYGEDMYVLMELIVTKATQFFSDERIATVEEIERLENEAILLTKSMDAHPEGYDGACQCKECMQAS